MITLIRGMKWALVLILSCATAYIVPGLLQIYQNKYIIGGLIFSVTILLYIISCFFINFYTIFILIIISNIFFIFSIIYFIVDYSKGRVDFNIAAIRRNAITSLILFAVFYHEYVVPWTPYREHEAESVSGVSMEPLLQNRDSLMVLWADDLTVSLGDVVFWWNPDSGDLDYRMGRVVGMPGDSVAIDQGKIWRNGDLFTYNCQSENGPVTCDESLSPDDEAYRVWVADDGFHPEPVSLDRILDGHRFIVPDNRDTRDGTPIGHQVDVAHITYVVLGRNFPNPGPID